MEQLIWELFKETGEIKYFLLAQKLHGTKESDKDEDHRYERTRFK